jgi:hypothetical protein
MGVTRKLLSASSLGLIDYRSDKERIARSARLTKRAIKTQNRMLRSAGPAMESSALDAVYAPAHQAVEPPPDWYVDQGNPELMRWWDGQRWTEHQQPR